MVAGEEACGQQPMSQVVEEDQREAHFICPLVPTGAISSVIFFLKWLPPSLELVLAGLAPRLVQCISCQGSCAA